MKRVYSLFLALLLMVSVSHAENFDFEGLSFDELASLRNQILLEMMSRDDWQEVLVPEGTYLVGEHIPAGHWTIAALPGRTTIITVGRVLEDDGKEIDYGCPGYYRVTLSDDQYPYYHLGDAQSTDLVLTNGTYVQVVVGGCLFYPYIGQDGLGFTFTD